MLVSKPIYIYLFFQKTLSRPRERCLVVENLSSEKESVKYMLLALLEHENCIAITIQTFRLLSGSFNFFLPKVKSFLCPHSACSSLAQTLNRSLYLEPFFLLLMSMFCTLRELMFESFNDSSPSVSVREQGTFLCFCILTLGYVSYKNQYHLVGG